MNRQVYETNDYSMFKFVKENRIIDSSHELRLIESIKRKNLTKNFPIVIDKDGNIYDGQHRFFACKHLGLPIYYIIAEEMAEQDISIINTVSKKWGLEDYLHQHAEKGNINYIKVKQFIEYSKCKSVNVALKLLYDAKRYSINGGGYVNGSKTFNFKNGDYIYPIDDSHAKTKIHQLREISEFTNDRNPYCQSLLAVYDTMREHEFFDIERLISKLKQYPLPVYNNMNTLLDAMNKVYNYNCGKNQPKQYFELIRKNKQNGAN